MKILYLMRHGETLFNQRKKIQGWCDSPLTTKGIAQAKIAGQYFKDHNITFSHAYSSTSERASDTLELVTEMPYERVKGIKEWNFGVFEGESEDLNPDLPYGDFFEKYGGEREKDFQERVSSTLTEIMRKENHETVLAVSHGASLGQFIKKWEHNGTLKYGDFRLRNCVILKFEFENDEFKLVDYVNHDFSELD